MPKSNFKFDKYWEEYQHNIPKTDSIARLILSKYMIFRTKRRGRVTEISLIEVLENHGFSVEEAEKYVDNSDFIKRYRGVCTLGDNFFSGSESNESYILKEPNELYQQPANKKKLEPYTMSKDTEDLAKLFIENIMRVLTHKKEEDYDIVEIGKDLDLLGRKIDLPIPELRKVLIWAWQDSFWTSQVLSVKRLLSTSKNGSRKIENIIVAMKKAKGKLKPYRKPLRLMTDDF